MRKWEEGGYDVEAPDYFVARVFLLGMPEAEFTCLGDVLRSCPVREVRSLAANLIKRATDRYWARKQSMEKCYINVCGGEFGSQNLKRAMLTCMLVEFRFQQVRHQGSRTTHARHRGGHNKIICPMCVRCIVCYIYTYISYERSHCT